MTKEERIKKVFDIAYQQVRLILDEEEIGNNLNVLTRELSPEEDFDAARLNMLSFCSDSEIKDIYDDMVKWSINGLYDTGNMYHFFCERISSVKKTNIEDEMNNNQSLVSWYHEKLKKKEN